MYQRLYLYPQTLPAWVDKDVLAEHASILEKLEKVRNRCDDVEKERRRLRISLEEVFDHKEADKLRQLRRELLGLIESERQLRIELNSWLKAVLLPRIATAAHQELPAKLKALHGELRTKLEALGFTTEAAAFQCTGYGAPEQIDGVYSVTTRWHPEIVLLSRAIESCRKMEGELADAESPGSAVFKNVEAIMQLQAMLTAEREDARRLAALF